MRLRMLRRSPASPRSPRSRSRSESARPPRCTRSLEASSASCPSIGPSSSMHIAMTDRTAGDEYLRIPVADIVAASRSTAKLRVHRRLRGRIRPPGRRGPSRRAALERDGDRERVQRPSRLSASRTDAHAPTTSGPARRASPCSATRSGRIVMPATARSSGERSASTARRRPWSA